MWQNEIQDEKASNGMIVSIVINHAGCHGGCNLQHSQTIKLSRFWWFNPEEKIFEMLQQSLF